MATDSQTHTFTWSGHGDTVIATGTFDNWQCSLPPLTRQADGTFAGQISLPHGDKVLYKYVVDGQWLTNPAEPIETDHSGNLNNVLHVPAKSTVLPPIAATADTVIIPTTTNTVSHSGDLPVPESAITVEGNVSETPALAGNSGTTSSNQPTAGKPLTETAQQVQARASELAHQTQAKAVEVAPQVQDKAKELATKAQETLVPAAATAGAAVVATAGAAAAGLASLTSSAAHAVAEDSSAARAVPINHVVSGPVPPPSTEQPKSPEATPLVGDDAAVEYKSHPTLPPDEVIASLAPSADSVTAPTSTTAAAPKYDEHTAVVAKDSTPVGPSTPIGAGDKAHTTTVPTTEAEITSDEHKPVEGYTAPKENPEDVHLYQAGAAAVGAAVAGAGVLGQKAVNAAKDSAPVAPSHSTATAPQDSAPHSTAAAPKYDEHTAVVAKDAGPVGVSAGTAHATAAAPKYDEHTAVVAKDATPVGPSTPIGAGDKAHTTTVPTTEAEPTSDEHKPVEGYIAPKENPEDVHLYHAGAAAIGAAVAGAELLGQKLVGAVHPHAVHAKEVGQQGLQGAAQTGTSYLEQAKQQAEHLREQAAAEAHRLAEEADRLAREAYAAAQEKAAAAQATVAGALHRGQEQAQQTAASAQQTAQQTATSAQQTVQQSVASAQYTAQEAAANAQKQAEQTATHVQAVVTGRPAEGAPNKDITPLPASEAPVASRAPSHALKGDKETPTVPGAEITSLPASEAPVAQQEGSNAMPNEANAVVPTHGDSAVVPTTAPSRELPNLPASEITPLPPSEAPVAEHEVSHAIAGQGSAQPAVTQASWAQSQLSNAATTPPAGVTRTSSSYASSAFTSQQQQEAPLYAAPAAVTATPTTFAAPAADLGPSTTHAARDPAVLAAPPSGGARSSTYSVPDRSTYEGGSRSPTAIKRASATGLPPPVAETQPPLNRAGSSEKALPRAPAAQTPPATVSETDTYAAHAGAPSTISAPSGPSTPSKPDERVATEPTTPADATVVGRHGGVTEAAATTTAAATTLEPSSAPVTPSPGGSDSGRDSSKKRGFFSRFLKKDKN
ncbi:hypothetical protein JCM3774_000600 [Rhodotorula dairenensis]